MTWELKNKIQEILAKETGAQCFAPGARRAFAFLYPNSCIRLLTAAAIRPVNAFFFRTAKRWPNTKEPKRR